MLDPEFKKLLDSYLARAQQSIANTVAPFELAQHFSKIAADPSISLPYKIDMNEMLKPGNRWMSRFIGLKIEDISHAGKGQFGEEMTDFTVAWLGHTNGSFWDLRYKKQDPMKLRLFQFKDMAPFQTLNGMDANSIYQPGSLANIMLYSPRIATDEKANKLMFKDNSQLFKAIMAIMSDQHLLEKIDENFIKKNNGILLANLKTINANYADVFGEKCDDSKYNCMVYSSLWAVGACLGKRAEKIKTQTGEKVDVPQFLAMDTIQKKNFIMSRFPRIYAEVKKKSNIQTAIDVLSDTLPEWFPQNSLIDISIVFDNMKQLCKDDPSLSKDFSVYTNGQYANVKIVPGKLFEKVCLSIIESMA